MTGRTQSIYPISAPDIIDAACLIYNLSDGVSHLDRSNKTVLSHGALNDERSRDGMYGVHCQDRGGTSYDIQILNDASPLPSDFAAQRRTILHTLDDEHASPPGTPIFVGEEVDYE